MTSTITRCEPGDGEPLAELVARAFEANPVARWLATDMGDEVGRHRLFRNYFRIFVEHALHAGQVEATADGAGVALWLLPDSGPPPDYEERMAAIVGRHLGRFETLDAAMDQAHPPGEHHHLAFVAVAPEEQGRGHGAVLLQHHHEQLEGLGLPAYLEASAPRNRALYERMGYQHLDASIELPDGPSMWPMMRPSRKPGG